MPTENRSSKTEMVSVPREWLNSVALLQMPLDELQEQAVEFLCEPCDEPAKQHQGEPVAPVINAEQVLGAYQFASFGPANHLRGTTNWCAAFAQELNHRIGADTAEVERIGKELREVREERDDLRRRVDDFQSRSHGIKNLSVIEQLNDKLAERDALLRAWLDMFAGGLKASPLELLESRTLAALSASAEPSAPVDLDERAAFEKGYHKDALHRDGDEYSRMAVQMAWEGWQARAALDRKHS